MLGLRPQYARGPLQRAFPGTGLSFVAHTGIIPDAQVMPPAREPPPLRPGLLPIMG